MSEREWWKKAVIYQIYPRSFSDANNDGIGDLAGITAKLDYLNDGKGNGLGIDAIWISPIFKSPMVDFGYDVSDYYAIDPVFGNMSDFETLMQEAHRRGMKVLLDLALNHTSDQHAWFLESKRSRDNPKADWYVWADPKPDGSPPNNWLSIFGGPAWTFVESRNQYYFHNFLKEQPDLNWYNPAVREELMNVVRFWMNKGVDGFRLDTASLYAYDRQLRNNPKRKLSADVKSEFKNPFDELEPVYQMTRPDNIEFIKELRKTFDEGTAMTSIGELGGMHHLESLVEFAAEYVKDSDRLHLAYTFAFLNEKTSPKYIARAVDHTEEVIEDGWPCWTFGNHDCTRLKTRYRCFGDREGLEQVVLLILFTLRGTPLLYYGDELGMPEYLITEKELKDPFGVQFWPDFKGRDGCRTPFPWSGSSVNQGFNAGAKPWLPAQSPITLDKAESDPHSTLNVVKEIIRIRKQHSALQTGHYRRIHLDKDCYAFERWDKDERILVVANFSPQQRKIKLDNHSYQSLSLKSFNRKGSFEHGQVVLPGLGFCLGRNF